MYNEWIVGLVKDCDPSLQGGAGTFVVRYCSVTLRAYLEDRVPSDKSFLLGDVGLVYMSFLFFDR